MNVRHPMGSFSIKNIFYDKMDLRLYFQMKIWRMQRTGLTREKKQPMTMFLFTLTVISSTLAIAMKYWKVLN